MKTSPDVLTTGQVAKICNVAPRTVSKWFDSGQLAGYRIPGSKDRRIPVEQLILFMEAHGMPLNGLEGDQLRLMFVDSDEELVSTVAKALELRKRYRLETAHCLFSAGVIAERFRPHVIILDVLLPQLDLTRLCLSLRGSPELQSTRLLAVGRGLTDAQGRDYVSRGFSAYLSKPFDLQMLVHAVEDVAAVAGGCPQPMPTV